MLTLNDGRTELWQWDTGRKLTVDAECSQVHFSNKVFGRSIDVDVADGVAIIPDILLQTDRELTAWAFVGTPENGYTKISKVFKVNKRNKPADYVFTPTEQTTLGELIERLDKIEESQDPDAIKNAVDDYIANNPIEIDEADPTVPEWAKQPTKPIYTASEVGALPADTVIPTIPDNVSAFRNDAGYLTEHQDLTGYATERYVQGYAQPKGDYLTAIPDGYAKIEDIPTRPEDIGAQPSGNYALKSEIPSVPVQSVNGQTGEVKLTAGDVGAISQDDLQEATNEALAQAKASGEFDGPQGPKGDNGDTGATGEQGEPGKDGTDGKDGYTPVKGVDYWTEEERNEIIEEVLSQTGDVCIGDTLGIVEQSGGYWSVEGNWASDSSLFSKHTELVEVVEGDNFRYTGCGMYAAASVLWYDKDKNLIGYEQYGADMNSETVTVTAPANSAYARFCSFNYGADTLELEVVVQLSERSIPEGFGGVSDEHINALIDAKLANFSFPSAEEAEF